jgi:glucose-1-phosphate thymidylyltransferase
MTNAIVIPFSNKRELLDSIKEQNSKWNKTCATHDLCGVILAGGKGTRLGELTRVTNKHLLPVGELPMIYYAIKKMYAIGIKNILIVTGTEHMGDFVNLLGSGTRLGVNLTYRVQDEAGGIAQALGLAERFCGNNRCLVVLGDNVFEDSLLNLVLKAAEYRDKAWIMLKEVPDPQRYGVAEIHPAGYIEKIVEKPKEPKGNMAVAGMYLYPNDVFDVIKTLKPSERGELEVTDINNHYLQQGKLKHVNLEGYWTDAGTPDSLDLANDLVRKKPPQW